MNLSEAFSKHSFIGCALRLHDYTANVNPKARFPYNAITHPTIRSKLNAYKVTGYDPKSTHAFTTADQEVNFILLCACIEGEMQTTQTTQATQTVGD